MSQEELEIRSLRGWEELEACVELQLQTWGAGDVVPASMLLAAQKSGAVLAGAFDAGALVGAVFGLPAVHDQRIGHWSHMLAVRESHRDRKIGLRLKAFQRQTLLRTGVRRASWTFDPLEARNAHFNLNRLGAQVDAYECNLYGAGGANILHRGIGTDRFVVQWQLDSERVRRALAGQAPAWSPDAESASIVNAAVEADGAIVPTRCDAAPAHLVRVEIPRDIQDLKRHLPAAAARWRQVTRAAFRDYLGRGFVVERFRRDAATQRCFYLLRQRTSR
ncbi:MAG: GNAT family N-acetyltransferase [Candidatus Latescibacterota bacterium]|nr:MAG: GNAT family N-acetyltransferase [Candidatus Latescibacterota bacterium]